MHNGGPGPEASDRASLSYVETLNPQPSRGVRVRRSLLRRRVDPARVVTAGMVVSVEHCTQRRRAAVQRSELGLQVVITRGGAAPSPPWRPIWTLAAPIPPCRDSARGECLASAIRSRAGWGGGGFLRVQPSLWPTAFRIACAASAKSHGDADFLYKRNSL